MNNFFCGLHLLVNLADDTAFRNESSIINYIEEAAKYTSRGGCEKSGQYVSYNDYMQQNNTKSKIIQFKGNWFNILFVDAEFVFCETGDIIDSIETITNMAITPEINLLDEEAALHLFCQWHSLVQDKESFMSMGIFIPK